LHSFGGLQRLGASLHRGNFSHIPISLDRGDNLLQSVYLVPQRICPCLGGDSALLGRCQLGEDGADLPCTDGGGIVRAIGLLVTV
jgi:hypothetical protein